MRLSGMSENDSEGHAAFRARFSKMIKPIHDDFNAFLARNNEGVPRYKSSLEMRWSTYPVLGICSSDDAYTIM